MVNGLPLGWVMVKLPDSPVYLFAGSVLAALACFGLTWVWLHSSSRQGFGDITPRDLSALRRVRAATFPVACLGALSGPRFGPWCCLYLLVDLALPW